MEISELNIPRKGSEPIYLGLNLSRTGLVENANLFALQENTGSSISNNLWTAANYIAEHVMLNKPIDDINWTLTCGDSRTALKFTTVNGQPLKIDVSNMHTLSFENYALTGFAQPLDVNKKEFAGQPPIHAAKGRVLERTMPEQPASIFTVPCSDAAAKDGVLHCLPSYYNVPHMRDQFEYVLVDTKKVVKSLKDHDPGMLDHAANHFGGSGVADWLEWTSTELPRDMGMWVPSRDGKGITMNSGAAALIQLVQELDVPYFPIAVDKGFAGQAQAMVGYSPTNDQARLPLGKPAFVSAEKTSYS